MIGKLGTLMIVVKDMNRSIQFYCDVLGLKVKTATPEWTSLDAGNIEIGLHAESKHLHVHPTESAGFAFFVPDMQQAVKHLKAHQVHILMPPKQESFGWLCVFTDPDGYHIQLNQPVAQQQRSAA